MQPAGRAAQSPRTVELILSRYEKTNFINVFHGVAYSKDSGGDFHGVLVFIPELHPSCMHHFFFLFLTRHNNKVET